MSFSSFQAACPSLAFTFSNFWNLIEGIIADRGELNLNFAMIFCSVLPMLSPFRSSTPAPSLIPQFKVSGLKCMILLLLLLLCTDYVSKPNGVAPTKTDPPYANTTTRQNPPICKPPCSNDLT